MAGKSNREKIRLMSSAGTGYYYTTMKNKRCLLYTSPSPRDL